ncbi:MAG: cysteine--tRNA ligase [Candidatus Omnitrophota bacterium]
MPIYIYNSLTRSKEEFSPINPPKVNIYTCGVTVYDDSHIGHARSLYTFEVIRRYLKYRGFRVRFVRNITDIDDKIIKRANELGIGWEALIKKYIARYYEDLKSLGISKADYEPRATRNIKSMIKYIQKLVKCGFAYVTDSGVYFSVRKFNDYGKLSNRSVDDLLSGVRKEADETKEDPLDFALWKKSKQSEPYWNSPWGRGRPGWHIECSVMSQKFLKTDTLDIHAGGIDLVFPHHENEIAQAQALTDKPFAKYWIHHGLLTINAQKMAKSLGNFVTIKDVLDKYPANVLKIFYLQAHYSSPLDFTWDRMEEARQALQRISILAEKAKKRKFSRVSSDTAKRIKKIDEIKNKFIEAMDDDFNTPQGLAAIFELINQTNKNIDDSVSVKKAHKILEEFLEIFSISLTTERQLDQDIRLKIEAREKARREKNFALSDQIRQELEVEGIILEDTKEGTTWRRKL